MAAKKANQNVMLAEKWDESVDPTGWWISEKLDGVRASWTGSSFYSRLGGKFPCPDWFRALMPKGVQLDGELWCGRKQFQQTVSIVKNSNKGDDWRFVTYQIFDLPDHPGGFEARIEQAKRLVSALPEAAQKHVKVIGMIRCTGVPHLLSELSRVEKGGGEGLMLRKPNSPYEYRRSSNLLKVKTFFDEEGIVVGHNRGSGRNAHRMGALLVRRPDGHVLKVGTGFTDEQRANPPKKGTVVTYRYQETSNSGSPRFPSFVGVRHDIDWSEYCRTYKPPGANMPPPLKRNPTILYASQLDVDMASAVTAKTSTAPAAASTNRKPRPACLYGTACYRKNTVHRAKFAHPGDADYTPNAAADDDGDNSAAAGDVDAADDPDRTQEIIGELEERGKETDSETEEEDEVSGEQAVTTTTTTTTTTTVTEAAAVVMETDSGDEEDSAVAVATSSKKTVISTKTTVADDSESATRRRVIPALLSDRTETPAAAPKPEPAGPAGEKHAAKPESTSTVNKHAAATVSGKPVCKYGTKCYRKNKEHLEAFYHPPSETEEGEREDECNAATSAVGGSGKYRASLIPVGSEDGVAIPQGTTMIGRGFLDIDDARLSTKHLELCFDSSAPVVKAVLHGKNKSMICRAGTHSFEYMLPGGTYELAGGDTVALLPDRSLQFRVEVNAFPEPPRSASTGATSLKRKASDEPAAQPPAAKRHKA